MIKVDVDSASGVKRQNFTLKHFRINVFRVIKHCVYTRLEWIYSTRSKWLKEYNKSGKCGGQCTIYTCGDPLLLVVCRVCLLNIFVCTVLHRRTRLLTFETSWEMSDGRSTAEPKIKKVRFLFCGQIDQYKKKRRYIYELEDLIENTRHRAGHKYGGP